MNFYVAATPSVRVRSSFPGAGVEPFVQFGEDARIALPSHGLYVVARDVEDDTLAAMVGATDQGIVVSRRHRMVTVWPVVHGPYGIQIEPDGVVSWVRRGGLFVDYADSRPATPADGRHPLAPDLSARADWDGITVVPQPAKGSWQIAEDGTTADGQTRILARMNGGPVLLAYEGYTPLPGQLTVFGDGSCVVAISLPKDEKTFFVESSAFTRYQKPALSFPPNPNRCAVLIDGGHGVPWFADIRYPQGTLGVLHHHNKPNELEAHIRKARDEKKVLYFYIDSHEPDDVFFPEDLPEDIAWLPMVQLYPVKGEPTEDMRDRFSAIVWKASLHPKFAVYLCGALGLGTDGERTEPQLIDGLQAGGELLAVNPRARLAAVWTETRGTSDGVARLPRVKAAVQALIGASRHATDYPTVAELMPAQPQAPKPPTPKPPAPIPAPAPSPVFRLEEFVMTAGAMTLMHSKFTPSAKLPGRFNYRSDDGSFLSVNAKGEVSASNTDHANTAFHWVKGSQRAWVWPDPGPFAVKHTFLVDEQD